MYKKRKCTEGKYEYLVECPICEQDRWVCNAKATYCKVCAGKISYSPPLTERCDKRKMGDGYITKQGYHLVYKDGRYTPLHRTLFEDLATNEVVHHIDGNKGNNDLDNLYVCTKKTHREVHGQLERLSYYLIQMGMIEFSEGTYNFGTSMKKFILANSVNSGNPASIDIDGNPEPSLLTVGRCNDYPFGEYAQVSGSAEDLNE